jgi:aryl-alcohol dehydrogenase-like predicted oxidoreductase
MTPEAATFDERVTLAPGYQASRVIRGGWQLAGDHGPVDEASLDADFLAAYDAGLTAFDCADIYTGVEERIGAFRAATSAKYGAERLARLKVHTKFVPDLDVLPRIDKAYVRGVIERSLRRLRQERLDIVQFHWWDYAAPRIVETALWLKDLQAEGKIDLIGATNFDTAHLEAMIAAGVPVKTLQVQYSLLDHRPAGAMAAACQRLGVTLLCYGSLAGGFLGERWLGAPEPETLTNRSLIKYKLIIDDWGGWALFQALLATLARVAARHGVTISGIAARHVLDRPAVGAVIIGARTGEHLARTVAIGRVALTAEDRAEIDAVLAQSRPLAGDVYTLERDRTGRHGSVMKYNLNG